jgi:hypothetical protein
LRGLRAPRALRLSTKTCTAVTRTPARGFAPIG